MYLQTYNLIEIMNELKKKRSRFKELIDTYCGANPYNLDLFLANVKKDEYALSVILEIMGYINDPAYFNNKEQMVFKNKFKSYFLPRLHTMHKEWDKNYHYENYRLELNEHSCRKNRDEKNRLLAKECFLIIYGLSMARIIKFTSKRHILKCICKLLNKNFNLQIIQNEYNFIDKFAVINAYQSVTKKIREHSQ